MPEQGVWVCFVNLPNAQIELIEPYGEDSHHAFLAKNPKGGQHHVCFEVEDIFAARDDMRAKGMTVLGTASPVSAPRHAGDLPASEGYGRCPHRADGDTESGALSVRRQPTLRLPGWRPASHDRSRILRTLARGDLRFALGLRLGFQRRLRAPRARPSRRLREAPSRRRCVFLGLAGGFGREPLGFLGGEALIARLDDRLSGSPPLQRGRVVGVQLCLCLFQQSLLGVRG